MAIKLSYDETLTLLMRAVDEKGADYVYHAVDPEKVEDAWLSDCVYFEETDGSYAPSCIVGHVLSYKGVDPDLLINLDINDDSVYSLKIQSVIDVDDKTYDLLTHAQKAQDQGYPWGQAVQQAFDNTKNGYKV